MIAVRVFGQPRGGRHLRGARSLGRSAPPCGCGGRLPRSGGFFSRTRSSAVCTDMGIVCYEFDMDMQFDRFVALMDDQKWQIVVSNALLRGGTKSNTRPQSAIRHVSQCISAWTASKPNPRESGREELPPFSLTVARRIARTCTLPAVRRPCTDAVRPLPTHAGRAVCIISRCRTASRCG